MISQIPKLWQCNGRELHTRNGSTAAVSLTLYEAPCPHWLQLWGSKRRNEVMKRGEKDGTEEGCELTIGGIHLFLVAALPGTTTALTPALQSGAQR